MANEQSSSLQWLETYVIRYTTGTILGSIIVYILCKKYENLTPLLFGLDINKIENPHIFLLLLVYGLCFCYIASGPVLILHTGRFYLRLADNFSKSRRYWNYILLYAVPCILPIAYLFFGTGTEKNSISDLSFWGISLASLVLWGQCFAVGHILYYRKDLYDFYKRLSEERAKKENQELVNSYRKLKDHGNAFMILFCEYALGVLLDWTNSLEQGSNYANFILLLLWIMPSAAIWLGATNIEYYLVYKEEKPHSTK